MLSLRGLGKDYGTRMAVRSIDLDVAAGECLGLLGPNGAGKTTTLSMICGVLAPTRGTVTIAGADVHADPYVAKAHLGLVPQDLALYDELTAGQNLRYFGALYGLGGPLLVERVRGVLDAVGLSARAHDRVATFSGGMKRRLNIAAALVHQPKLVVLDEPTVGIDPQSRALIFEIVRSLARGGTTVVYSSHYFEEIEALCDRIAILDHGEVIALGTVRELVGAHGTKHIVIEIAADAAQLAAAVRAAREHARVEVDGGTLRVVPHAGLASVIAAIESSGASLVRVEALGTTLESAFMALTGHGMRDAAP